MGAEGEEGLGVERVRRACIVSAGWDQISGCDTYRRREVRSGGKIPVCPFALAMWRVLFPVSGSIDERRRVEGGVERDLERWESVDLSSRVSPTRARKRSSEIVSGSRGGGVAVGIVGGGWVGV